MRLLWRRSRRKRFRLSLPERPSGAGGWLAPFGVLWLLEPQFRLRASRWLGKLNLRCTTSKALRRG